MSSEIHLTDLHEKLLKIILENAKANKGILIAEKQHQFYITAQASISNTGSFTFEAKHKNPEQCALRSHLPLSIIKRAKNKQSHLVLNNVLQHKDFLEDPYIIIKKPRSIFCTPISSRDQKSGILYLETYHTNNLFTPEKTSDLLLLVEQAAISLENARRYTLLEEQITKQTHELNIARKKNKNVNLARTQFLADMNHEIRTPVNAIIGFSQLLKKKGEQLHLPDDFQHYLESIQNSGAKLSELIDNVLEFSRIDSERIVLEIEKIDIRLMIQGIYHANKEQAVRKDIRLKYEFDEQTPLYVHSDRAALNKVLMTLVDNAIKHTPAEKSVIIKTASNKESFLLMVEDQGIGIPHHKRSQVFKAFDRIKNDRPKELDNTGLSLAIIKKIVEKLKGDIWFTSQEGKGSLFTVAIPQKKKGLLSENKYQCPDINKLFSSDNRILVVEDSPSNQEMFQALLQELGPEVWVADTEKEGIKTARNIKPDLILINLHMPGMDKEGCKMIRQIHKTEEISHTPIIALSADRFHHKQEDIKLEDSIEYLIRPYDLERLITLLKKYLRPLKDYSTEKKEVGKKKATEGMEGKTIKSNLPEEAEKQLLDNFKALAQIPIYKGGTLLNLIRQMLKTCGNYNSIYPPILKQIETEVFEGNAAQLKRLIDAALGNRRKKTTDLTSVK